MDRLKLETTYLRALDGVMSAVDEYQLQAAKFRLRSAQARLHGWGMPASRCPERRGLGRDYLVARAGAPLLRLGIRLKRHRTSRPVRLAVPTDNREIERRVPITFEGLLQWQLKFIAVILRADGRRYRLCPKRRRLRRPALNRPTPGHLLDQDYLTSTGQSVPRRGVPPGVGHDAA